MANIHVNIFKFLDLDIFIKEYLVICNVAVDEYNNKVKKEIENKYLIIY